VMDEAERICGNCHKLARAECNCSYHELWDRISRLESALKRLEWGKYGTQCPACDGYALNPPKDIVIVGNPAAFGHRTDCWLAAEIAGDALK
jgi:hypothetical protein